VGRENGRGDDVGTRWRCWRLRYLAKLVQQSQAIMQQGQITDRFTKAIEQLGAVDPGGKKKMEVRLGGIYALERIADESESHHWPIMEVLCTYVRENAPKKQESPPGGKQNPGETAQENQAPTPALRPPADIQAILTVLGRRDYKYQRKDQYLDLRDTDLSGVQLLKANLSSTWLVGANLSGAYLLEVGLLWTDLRWANLNGADLSAAHLIWASLSGADLSDARGLTQEQIELAIGDANTKLPAGLHMPESWKT
jgi:hypothetical protein